MTELTNNNFQSEVLDAKGIVIVDVWAPWCGPCRQMTPIFERLAAFYGSKVKFAKLNCDVVQELAKELEIKSIPTFLVYKDGKRIDSKIGAMSEKDLSEYIAHLFSLEFPPLGSLDCARQSLLALSVGDAYGENILKFLPPKLPGTSKAGNVERSWHDETWSFFWTDDTHEAISIYRCLEKFSGIDQDWLIDKMVKEYMADPHRGYGGGAQKLFRDIAAGGNWKTLATNMFGPGQGSYGNGGAMRSAPIGAFFGAENLNLISGETTKATMVTHANVDAVDGAIAVAIAAAIADNVGQFWTAILDTLNDGPVKRKILEASKFPITTSVEMAAAALGTGLRVSALDTVPFALWLADAGLILEEFETPMQMATQVNGDTDTICAMVGGIIGNVLFPPEEWIAKTEPLRL